MKPKLGILLTHPIQYYSPWFRHLSEATDLYVYYAHKQTAEGQAEAGFGKAFEWDIPLLDGYRWQWLNNISKRPGLDHFTGIDTPEIAEIIARERFDAFIMFGWNAKCFIQAGLACHRTRTQLFIRLDSQKGMQTSALKRLVKQPIYSAILPWAAHYLTPGVRSDAYLQQFGVPERRIHRLHHMIDVDRFRSQSGAVEKSGRAGQIRKELGISSDEFVFLFVGKLLNSKRPGLILSAIPPLSQTSLASARHATLLIVGEGPERAFLERTAENENLPVKFLGFVNQGAIPSVYAASNCLIVPSNETWGLVVNEAFACDTPCIVSDEAGCAPDLIDEGKTGWILRSPDAASLARLMETALREARSLPREALRAKSEMGSYQAGVRDLLAILETVKSGR